MKALMMLNRELKRVPLDFDWEMNKIWKGYKNPFYKKCSVCDGRGYTEARQKLDEIIDYLVYCKIEGMQELLLGLAQMKPEDLSPIGFAGNDRYKITLRILRLAGLSKKWGWCPTCKGENMDPKMKKDYDHWISYGPPVGKGYQCWETCSEGSPISPVFKTLDELCEWLFLNKSSRGLTENFSKEDWKNALLDDSPVIDFQSKELVLSDNKEPKK